MKALTISQPYASLIASGAKWVENRTWPTRYRGLLAIHAGKGTQYLNSGALTHYQTGCILATVNLVACVLQTDIEKNANDAKQCNKMIPGTSLTWVTVYKHRHTEGPWCWILTDARALAEPVPISGKQGLWDWNGHFTDTRKL